MSEEKLKKFSGIKWVFFDVGFTLVDEYKTTEVRAKKQELHESCKSINLTSKKILDEMYIVSQEYTNPYKGVMKKYNILDIEPHIAELEIVYPEAYEVLDYLMGKYHLGIIANQGEGLKDRLKQRNLDKYFEVVVSSFDVNIHKPDPAIFELGLKESGANANECLYIGDRLDNDVYPSKLLGFKTIRIKRGYAETQVPRDEKYEPDYTITNLKELIKLL